MSHADLAFEIRRVSDGRLKPTEKSIRSWIKGEHTPREGVVAAIAAATGQTIAFFYEPDSDDEEEESRLLRDLEQLPADLRARLIARLERADRVSSVEAPTP